MQMSQREWGAWAQQRQADAPKIAKQYEREAARVMQVLYERGCTCDPMIDMDPSTGQPQVMHAMDCPTL